MNKKDHFDPIHYKAGKVISSFETLCVSAAALPVSSGYTAVFTSSVSFLSERACLSIREQ